MLAAALLCGCVETLPPLDEITSLRVELTMPTDPGSDEVRLPDTVVSAQIVVTAIDSRGEVADLDGPVKVYTQFLGSITPALGTAPIATIMLTDGVSAPSMVPLPRVYGPTTLWVEDDREGGTYPTGTSPVLWFRDPFVSDLTRPRDEMALDALESSPLEGKQVIVSSSRYGARGRMVVTATGAQNYSVSDVECADANGTPPCVAGDYDHVLIFTFQRPRDEMGRSITPGQFIDGFAGGVQEFNGLTEIGFPQTFVSEDPISNDQARIPAPVVIDQTWFSNIILFERNESAVVEMRNATVCPLDQDYEMYRQWKLDIGRGCGTPINVVSSLGSAFDPEPYEGMQLARVIGMLEPVNIGTFNVWIVKSRNDAEIIP